MTGVSAPVLFLVSHLNLVFVVSSTGFPNTHPPLTLLLDQGPDMTDMTVLSCSCIHLVYSCLYSYHASLWSHLHKLHDNIILTVVRMRVADLGVEYTIGNPSK